MRNINRIILFVIISLFPLSCYNGLNDMYDELGMKVPICVDSSVAASGDGRGWQNAFKTIQDAINASSTSDGDVIWVAGTYDITSTIHITKQVSIYGGFSGVESRRDERNLDNKTKITGNMSKGIMVQSDNVVIDGFKIWKYTAANSISLENNYYLLIQNCDFGDEVDATMTGPAIFVLSGRVDIRSCSFKKIELSMPLSNGGAVNADNAVVNIEDSLFKSLSVPNCNGGTIYAVNSIITLKNCSFTGNHAENGGACYFENIDSLTIDNCSFGTSTDAGNNSADTDGGAVYLNAANAVIKNSRFYANGINGTVKTDAGGAIYSDSNSSLSIIDTIISGNQVTEVAGGNGGGIFSEGTLTITGSEFNNNRANTNGGAICSSSADLSLKNCKIYDNNASDRGGSVYKNGYNFEIINCLFYGNSASDYGGAISLDTVVTCKIYLSTFAYNNSDDGGAIYATDGQIFFYNSIEFENIGYNTVGFVSMSSGNLWLYNSRYAGGIQGNSFPVDCIAADPKFVNALANDFNLMSDSPCVDHGNYSYIPSGVTNDLTGNIRISGTVDMGCYERE